MSGELQVDQIRSGIERRCGDTREACNADDDAAVVRLGSRQATSDGDGTNAMMSVEPEMATPGPMYAGFSGAGWELNPDEVESLAAAVDDADRTA